VEAGGGDAEDLPRQFRREEGFLLYQKVRLGKASGAVSGADDREKKVLRRVAQRPTNTHQAGKKKQREKKGQSGGNAGRTARMTTWKVFVRSQDISSGGGERH